MKVRSKELYRYLRAQGALSGSKQEILRAKRNYRRLYKNRWARQNRKRHHEVRFHIDKAVYEKILEACGTKITPGALAKELLVAYALGHQHIPSKESLLSVHKYLGLALNLIYRNKAPLEIKVRLEQAEELLGQYLNLNEQEPCQ